MGIDSSAFFTEFTAEYNELSISGALSANDSGGYKINVTAPENLKGLTAEYNGDKIKLSYLGLSKEFSRDSLPQYNVIFTVCDVIDSVVHSRAVAEKTDDGYILNGELSGTTYTLTLNSDRKPQTLTVDSEKPMTVKFSS